MTKKRTIILTVLCFILVAVTLIIWQARRATTSFQPSIARRGDELTVTTKSQWAQLLDANPNHPIIIKQNGKDIFWTYDRVKRELNIKAGLLEGGQGASQAELTGARLKIRNFLSGPGVISNELYQSLQSYADGESGYVFSWIGCALIGVPWKPEHPSITPETYFVLPNTPPATYSVYIPSNHFCGGTIFPVRTSLKIQ